MLFTIVRNLVGLCAFFHSWWLGVLALCCLILPKGDINKNAGCIYVGATLRVLFEFTCLGLGLYAIYVKFGVQPFWIATITSFVVFFVEVFYNVANGRG